MRIIYDWIFGCVYLTLLMVAWRSASGLSIIDALPVWDRGEMLAIALFAAAGAVLIHVIWKGLMKLAEIC